jgi:hypothetical protein
VPIFESRQLRHIVSASWWRNENNQFSTGHPPPAFWTPHEHAQRVAHRPRRHHSLGSRRNRHECQRGPVWKPDAVILALPTPAGQHRRCRACSRRACVGHRAQRARRRPRLPILLANERRRQLPRESATGGDRRHSRVPYWLCGAHPRRASASRTRSWWCTRCAPTVSSGRGRRALQRRCCAPPTARLCERPSGLVRSTGSSRVRSHF